MRLRLGARYTESEMKNIFAIIVIRVFLLAVLAVAGFIGYRVLAGKTGSVLSINKLTDKINEVSGKTHLGVVSNVLDQVSKKLTDSQPIAQSPVLVQPTGQVIGATTDALTDQVKNVLQNASNQIMDQIKGLPKKEAARVTRQMCDQIVSELEK